MEQGGKRLSESAGGARTSSRGERAERGAGEAMSGPPTGTRTLAGGGGGQGQRQMGMRSIREWLLTGAGAGRVQETAARGVEGVRESGDGGRPETKTAGLETGQMGDYEGAGGPGVRESIGSPATGGDGPGGEEGPGVARRQAGGRGAGVVGVFFFFFWITSYISNQFYDGNQLSLSGFTLGPAYYDR